MKLSKIVCRDKEERIFFNFVSKIIRKDRDFKTTVYTTMGANMAFFIYLIFDRDPGHINSYMYLFLYFYVLSIPTIIIALKNSRNFKASYIYTTMPIKNKMNVHKASIKACLVNIIIPLYLIQSIAFICLYKMSIIKHIVIVFLITMFITIVTFKVIDKSMPFSKQINVLKKNEYISESYLMMFLILIVGVIHFVSSSIGIKALTIYTIVLLMANIYLYKTAFKEKILS